MIEYILNGKTVKVSPENEEALLEANPSAKKKTSWWKGEEGFVPDELEFWKKKEETESPGKSQEAGQPQNNQQQEDTESSSEIGSSELAAYKLNDEIVKTPNRVENNLFVGSTAELQKLIKKNGK